MNEMKIDVNEVLARVKRDIEPFKLPNPKLFFKHSNKLYIMLIINASDDYIEHQANVSALALTLWRESDKYIKMTLTENQPMLGTLIKMNKKFGFKEYK